MARPEPTAALVDDEDELAGIDPVEAIAAMRATLRAELPAFAEFDDELDHAVHEFDRAALELDRAASCTPPELGQVRAAVSIARHARRSLLAAAMARRRPKSSEPARLGTGGLEGDIGQTALSVNGTTRLAGCACAVEVPR
jgi:hypothetical protein